ncbi:MAG: TlpA family protein disulfide reductase, partial [Lachnospiraceae bacterium]|nr:TlpA family protein disulfide reductase [Lachnospiraceae bacterium]
PYCVKEMPELAQMEERLREKGCGILGLDYETSLTGDEALQAAKEALEEYGVSYPNAVLPEELGAKISSFPTTFFVNRDGVVLTMPIVGAYVDSYEPTIDALLKGTIEAAAPIVPAADAENAESTGDEQESTGDEQESGSAVAASQYRVIVNDADGPVEGVMVQMCDDSVCNMAKTDAEGIAAFDLPAGISYEVHVLKVPEGYEEDATVYHTAETYEDVTIELVKK